MTYPKHLYRAGGIYGNAPRSFSVIGCADAGQEAALLAQGWFLSVEDAYAPTTAKEVIQTAEALEDMVDDMSPATRDELEQKARELGLPFNARTKDGVLAKRIADAIE